MKRLFAYSLEEITKQVFLTLQQSKNKIPQLNIPPWHPFAVCLLAVQQVSQQPQAAIKRDIKRNQTPLDQNLCKRKYRFTKPYSP